MNATLPVALHAGINKLADIPESRYPRTLQRLFAGFLNLREVKFLSSSAVRKINEAPIAYHGNEREAAFYAAFCKLNNVGSADDGATPCKVESIKLGEYVKRKADSSKVYKRGAYDRSSKRYSLIDCDDINREVFVKRGTILFIGFTY